MVQVRTGCVWNCTHKWCGRTEEYRIRVDIKEIPRHAADVFDKA